MPWLAGYKLKGGSDADRIMGNGSHISAKRLKARHTVRWPSGPQPPNRIEIEHRRMAVGTTGSCP